MPHLTPDIVARFSARTLDRRERGQAFEHLADCAACREWVAANAQLGVAKPRRPVWQATAAGIAVAFFAWWLTAARPAGEMASRRVELPVTALEWKADTEPDPLPAPWRQIRLTPMAQPANQVSLTTTFGEKWIAVDGALGQPAQ